MDYFFISLIKTLLPISLLASGLWLFSAQINLKKIFFIAVFGFTFGIGISFLLPVLQWVKLTIVIFLLFVFILFFIARIISYLKIVSHFLLFVAAGIFFASDPNVVGLFSIDVINTDFLLQFGALIFGVFFCLMSAIWFYFVLRQIKTPGKIIAPFFAFVSLIFILSLVGNGLLILMKLQVIELTPLRLTFVAKSAKLLTYFNFISCFLLFILLIYFIFQVYFPRKKQVSNISQSIEKRKALASLRMAKQLLGIGFFIVVSILSAQLYWDHIASQPPRLSQAKKVLLDENEQVRISLNSVRDGKLHRFVWVADDGKAIRFFIINRVVDKLSLAVVFDACLLCGDQGYVMEGNQVVCVGCGVHLFIPSIGKPGGCNPVPIENWQQTEHEIVIPRQSLQEGAAFFSSVLEIDVIDPVSLVKLRNTQTEYKYSYEGKTYFFENETNFEHFREYPEKYLMKKEK